MNYIEVWRVFSGSDAEATKALYAKLEAIGPRGGIAMNLFRACKASTRAKLYRGGDRRGSYKSQAYDRKLWSMDNLCRALVAQADDLGVEWGWGYDRKAVGFEHVLYVEVPNIGQISFHAERRGDGHDFDGVWDGAVEKSADRICRWCSELLTAKAADEMQRAVDGDQGAQA